MLAFISELMLREFSEQVYFLCITIKTLLTFCFHFFQGNYIASVELYVPTKTSTLDFLDNSRRQPPREALATVFFAKNTPPVVRQYVVGPLPRPTYHKINPRMTKDVPAAKLTMHRFGEAYRFIYQQTGHPEVQRLLWESFGAMSNCTGSWKDPCIMFLGQKISFGLSECFLFI